MNETFILIAVLAVMAVYFIIWKVLPFLRKAKKATKGLFGKIYLNKNADLPEHQYRQLSLGAIYSEQQTAYINSLTTGLGKSTIKEALSEWWGVANREEAIDRLDYLKNKGFRFYFLVVYRAFLAEDESTNKQLIISAFNQDDESYDEDVEKAFSQLQNIHETWAELTENKVLSTTEELEKYHNVGWDCGRLVYLTRMCFDADYLSEAESWAYIQHAYSLATRHFNDWEAYAKSYVIGRSMWGGTQSANAGIIDIADYLLKEQNSPWIQLTFKS